MAKEKRKLEFTVKHFSYVGGIALCLLSIICILNIGVFARVFTFLFLSPFGLGSYLIYAFVYAEGIILLFKERFIKIKYKSRYFGAIIFFFGLIILLTAILVNKDLLVDSKTAMDAFNTMYKSIEPNFFLANQIAPFNIQTTNFAGGFVGYVLAGLFASFGGGNIAITYVLSILILLGGLAIIFAHEIKLLYIMIRKKTDPKYKEANKTYEEKPKKERKPLFSFFKKDTTEKTRNIDVISSASSLEEEEPTSTTIRRVEPTPTPMTNVPYQGNIYSSGQFVPARFTPSFEIRKETPAVPLMEEYSEPKPVVEERVETFESVEPSFSNKNDLEIEREKDTQVLLDALERQNKQEQLSIFEEERPTYDPNIVGIQPEFEEPIISKEGKNDLVVKPRERVEWVAPGLDLLNDYVNNDSDSANIEVAENRKQLITEILNDFNIGAECTGYIIGPAVTRYNIQTNSGVSVSMINRVVNDIAIKLNGVAARFQQLIKGESFSGLEIPNAKVSSVSFKEVMQNLKDVEKHPLAIGFGKDISGNIVQADFNEFPHLLVAGTTGSGKSVFIHSVIMTLIMRNSPDDLKLVLVDPKQVEMNMYSDLPHLLTPIINDANRAKDVLTKLCDEMDRRYSLFKNEMVLDIKEYNRIAKEKGKETLPTIIIMFDEYADCVEQCKEISKPVVRIAQKARAAGVHLLISTQRPSTNVVTGVIKSNLPTHVALLCSSPTDSVTIINEGGAEKLLGKGDMLVQTPLLSTIGVTRIQSPYVTPYEIRNVVMYLRERYPAQYDPIYDEVIEEVEDTSTYMDEDTPIVANIIRPKPAADFKDDLYESVKEYVMSMDTVSISKIQGDWQIGFSRARRLFLKLQYDGIVENNDNPGAKGCHVLIHDDRYLPNKEESNINPSESDEQLL